MPKKFDVVLATSVIEHLKYPEKFLINMKKVLKSHGQIIVSTPNISHWSMRIELLKGNFDYQEYGILDKTHLHFFTPKTYQQMFRDAGYTILEYKIDDVGGGYPRLAKSLSRFFSSLFTYQMLIVASKK